MHPYIIEQLAAEHRQELLRAAREYHVAAHARTFTARDRRWRALPDRFGRALRIIGNPRPLISLRSQRESLTIPMLVDLTCCAEPILSRHSWRAARSVEHGGGHSRAKQPHGHHACE